MGVLIRFPSPRGRAVPADFLRHYGDEEPGERVQRRLLQVSAALVLLSHVALTWMDLPLR